MSSTTTMETWFGVIRTLEDAVKVVEAARTGVLPRVTRRLTEEERAVMVRSGSVFVFEESESQVRRWADGKLWSSSRMKGHFLVYTELDGSATISGADQNPDRAPQGYNSSNDMTPTPFGAHSKPSSVSPQPGDAANNNGGASFGGTSARPLLKKKALSLSTIYGNKLRLISYYNESDFEGDVLPTPDRDAKLAQLAVPEGLYFAGNDSPIALARSRPLPFTTAGGAVAVSSQVGGAPIRIMVRQRSDEPGYASPADYTPQHQRYYGGHSASYPQGHARATEHHTSHHSYPPQTDQHYPYPSPSPRGNYTVQGGSGSAYSSFWRLGQEYSGEQRAQGRSPVHQPMDTTMAATPVESPVGLHPAALPHPDSHGYHAMRVSSAMPNSGHGSTSHAFAAYRSPATGEYSAGVSSGATSPGRHVERVSGSSTPQSSVRQPFPSNDSTEMRHNSLSAAPAWGHHEYGADEPMTEELTASLHRLSAAPAADDDDLPPIADPKFSPGRPRSHSPTRSAAGFQIPEQLHQQQQSPRKLPVGSASTPETRYDGLHDEDARQLRALDLRLTL